MRFLKTPPLTTTELGFSRGLLGARRWELENMPPVNMFWVPARVAMLRRSCQR